MTEEPFYTVQRVDALRRQVEYYGLEVPLEFWSLSLPKLQKYCNGCGAENWSYLKRKALTIALSRYEAAFFVHDVCYELMADRTEADKILYRNMLIIFRRDFGIFWWLKKTGWAERIGIIPVVYGLVALGGDEAYTEAQKKKKGGAA
jgi:hypothetical protein